jgi:histidinol-phosphate aminotransferase
MDISKYVPAWIRTLTPYQPGKPIEELERQYGIHDSIKIASNENPLGPSPRAVAAITAALPDLHRYPDGDAFYLKRRLAEKLGLDRSRLIIGNGSNELIEMIVRTFLRVGEAVVVGKHAFRDLPFSHASRRRTDYCRATQGVQIRPGGDGACGDSPHSHHLSR